MTVSLQLKDVHKSYSTEVRLVEVLKGISFELPPASALAIMGPSGSGKSTLLHLIGTLDSPTSGEIVINNQNPFALPEPELARFRNTVIGFVFQDHHLLQQYSLLENVILPTLAFPDRKRDAKQRARELLDKVGLGHRLDHRPGQLSGGECQRAAVARALINKPWLMLCDEPTGNLDSDNSNAVADLLFDLHKQEGNILIVVTHSSEIGARFEQKRQLRDGQLLS